MHSQQGGNRRRSAESRQLVYLRLGEAYMENRDTHDLQLNFQQRSQLPWTKEMMFCCLPTRNFTIGTAPLPTCMSVERRGGARLQCREKRKGRRHEYVLCAEEVPGKASERFFSALCRDIHMHRPRML